MKIKNIVIAVMAFIIGCLLVVILNQRRTNNMANYAIANDCEWVATGTMYGDDRDFLCIKK